MRPKYLPFLILVPSIVFAQPIITTIAGRDFIPPFDGMTATSAPLQSVSAVAISPEGNIYFAQADWPYASPPVVMQLNSDGKIRVIAGNGSHGFSGDGGSATHASLNNPSGLAAGPNGTIYIADTNNGRIRKVDSQGIITTVVTGLTGPGAVTLDAAGNLYIVEVSGHRVRRVTPQGVSTIIAGTGQQGFGGDNGPATSAQFNAPRGVAVDSAGNVYVADYGNDRVRKISNGIITTIAGTGKTTPSGDGGPATQAGMGSPWGLSIDPSRNLYVVDYNNRQVRKISASGTISTLGGGPSGDPVRESVSATGPGALSLPLAVAFNPAGFLLVGDAGSQRVRAIDTNGIVSTVAGNGQGNFSGDHGPSFNAGLNSPTWIALDASGGYYFSDTANNRVRHVGADGIIQTIAGTGSADFSGDGGPAGKAALHTPRGLALDKNGNLYISDSENHRIREITQDGNINTIAGTGGGQVNDGGPAKLAGLVLPHGLAFDTAGNLFVADHGHFLVRMITTDGKITTVAGINGVADHTGEGGPAVKATLFLPVDVAVDSRGNVYVCEVAGHRVSRFTVGGNLNTVAGTGTAGFSGDGGPATSANLQYPFGITLDAAGNLYIADSLNNRIRKVSSGTITTIAGNGVAAFLGDGGRAISASLNGPSNVVLDSAGDLFISDTLNGRIREALVGTVSYQATPASLSFSAGPGGSPPGGQVITLSTAVPGLPFTATTNVPWLTVSPSSGAVPATLQATVDPSSLTAGTNTATITITVPSATPSTRTVAVIFSVQPPTPASLGVDTKTVSLSASQAGSPVTQQLHVSNSGGGSFAFTATATTSTGGSWLALSPASGTVTAASPASPVVTATPGSLAPGTYNGAITITGAGSTTTIPVTLSVSAPTATILLSQTALSFTAVAQGGMPLPQNFGVLNTGQGSMSWTATATTLSGGNWLQISPASGTVPRPYLDASLVNVQIDPSTLAADTYYGRIQVAAVAANTPQVLTVILKVLPPGSNLGPQVFPAGLVFTGVAGVTPGSQDVQVANPSGQANNFQSGQIGTGFSYLPATATLSATQPTTVRVFPDFSKLTAGSVQQGTITLQFADRSPSQTISVLTVVAPAGVTPNSQRANARRSSPDAQTEASGCATQKLLVVFRSPQPSQTTVGATVGTSMTIDVQVTDACGNLIGPGGEAAQVTAHFSTNESVTMAHIGNGIWQGSWRPVGAGSTLMQVDAFTGKDANVVGGQSSILTAVVITPAPAAATPTVTAQGVVHAASSLGGVPIAPGGLVSIYGANLSDSSGQGNGLPLPQQLNGTQVLLGNQPLPILYTSTGQLNVQVPYGVPLNTQYQVTVQRGNALSVPQALTVAAADPGIFTTNQQGTGQGAIVKSDQVTIAQPGTPANQGETIVIYCTGLGLVTPRVKEGAPAPTTPPLSTTDNSVTVTIGGKAATVAFSGLTPGYAGLYQINAVVPSGIATGDAVPVVVSVAGQTSPPVTIAVK